MPQLQILYCNNNLIKDFDVSNLTEMNELDLSFNKISYSISKFYLLKNLKYINLNSNMIKGLNDVATNSIQLHSLLKLQIEDNQINSLKSMSALNDTKAFPKLDSL